MLHYRNSRYAAALARRLNLALRDLALRPWSILIEGRERAFSDCATPSYRCYRHQAYTPVTTQMPCFATVSAADLALRGLFTPMRSCCQARICPRSSDPSWVASLYALSLHRAVATVNTVNIAVNTMMALAMRGLNCCCRPGGHAGRQTYHVALATVFPLLQGLYVYTPPHLSASPPYTLTHSARHPPLPRHTPLCHVTTPPVHLPPILSLTQPDTS